MRKKMLLAVLATVPAIAVATPADAVGRVCVATGNVTFSPPLTAFNQDGTMTWDYTNNCVRVESNGGSGAEIYDGSATYSYSGSCVTANVTSSTGSFGILVGGTTMTRTDTTPTAVRQWTLVLHNTSPCTLTSATVVQGGPDVLL